MNIMPSLIPRTLYGTESFNIVRVLSIVKDVPLRTRRALLP